MHVPVCTFMYCVVLDKMCDSWQLNLYDPTLVQQVQGSGFPVACADSAAADGRRRSNVYEVNQWL